MTPPEAQHTKVLAWDLPMRFFHLGFAACCTAALAIAFFADKESAIFPYHMLLGITACFFLVVRIVLGVAGGPRNGLKELFFSPLETARYFAGVFTGRAQRYAAHNPGTAAAALGMFAVTALLAFTGIKNTTDESFGEPHEVLAYALVALVAAHLLGLAIHTLRHRENIGFAMVSGRKVAPASTALETSRPVFAVVLAVASAAWIWALFASYDRATGFAKVPLLGQSLYLGEPEEEGEHEGHD